MYYIAWLVNMTGAATKTKVILMVHEHIVNSRWFSAQVRFEAILEDSVVSLEDQFGLPNLGLLDVISYMECELDSQWRAEIKNKNITGHGEFGYDYHEKISSLDTQHLAFAAREMVLLVGMVNYCIRLADLAERMVSGLEDEVEKLRTTTQQSNYWTSLSSMVLSLDLNKKKIWNFKVETKDVDNRVRAQSDALSILFLLFSGIKAEIWTHLQPN